MVPLMFLPFKNGFDDQINDMLELPVMAGSSFWEKILWQKEYLFQPVIIPAMIL